MRDNALPAPTRQGLQALALHPGAHFGRDAAAAALSMPVEEAAGLLRALVRGRSLVEVSPRRYKLAAGQRWTRQVSRDDPRHQEGLRRIVDWYQVTAAAAGEVLAFYRTGPSVSSARPAAEAGRFPTWNEALDWLETERVNLVAAVHAAAPDMPDVALTLADTMWPLFRLGGYYPDRLGVDRVALDCARRLDRPALQSAVSQRAAEGLCDVGRFGEAEPLLRSCLRAGERGGDTRRIAAALGGLTAAALAQQQFDQAERYACRAVSVSKAGGSTRRRALALLVLGQVYRTSSRSKLALAHVRDARRLLQTLTRVDHLTRSRILPDPYTSVWSQVEYGLALSADGKHQQAVGILAQARTAMATLHTRRGQAIALHALGQVTAALGDNTAARRHLRDALHLSAALSEREAAAVRHLLGQLPPSEDTS